VKSRRRYLILLLCAIILLGLYLGICYFDFDDGNFSFKTNNIDLGLVENNTTVTARFPFRNRSDDVIEIKKIISDCACSTAEASNNIIKPGEEGFVEVELTTSSNRGQEKHDILVLTAPPCENKYRLSFSLVIDPQITIVPTVISFGCFDNYQNVLPKEAIIISSLVKEAKFIGAKSKQSYIAVDCIDKPSFDKREIGRISIKLVSQPPSDNFEGSVNVYTKTDKGVKINKLQVVGFVSKGIK
jgi:hypothetical protein